MTHEPAMYHVTLCDLLIEIRERGWLVSNLFQLDSGVWQANLRTATHHTDFGRGSTPELALSLAIDAIERAELTARSDAIIVNNDLLAAPSADLASLLANLRKPKLPTVTRRL
jgi:hypothetical protein